MVRENATYRIHLRRVVIEETTVDVVASSELAARRRARLLANGYTRPLEIDDEKVEDEGEWMQIALGKAATKSVVKL